METIVGYAVRYGVSGAALVRLQLEHAGWSPVMQVDSSSLAAITALLETGVARFDSQSNEIHVTRTGKVQVLDEL
jgi:hypothetical protein